MVTRLSVKETLAQLVSIDSVSQRSNAPLVSYLEDRCRALGFTNQHFPYRDEAGTEKTNLVCIARADSSTKEKVELALVGHTDTVPFDPSWSDATRLVERDGRLYGRGACDTKGYLAAALTAVEQVGIESLKRSLALVFTADEEVGLVGAKKLARQKPFQARYCIVGEPTSLQPIRAGKGYCLAEIVVRGREGHSAYPALGKSAIFRAARVVSHLETIAEKLTSDQHEGFDPAFTTLNVGLIKGGTAKNVIPGECRLTLEWRPIPGQQPEKLLNHLSEALAFEKKMDPDFDCDIDAGRADSGFETPAHSQLVSFLESITLKASGTVAFGTEAAQMIQLGAETVVLGPGNIRVAHQSGEYVPAAELEGCVGLLEHAIKRFCC